MMIINFQSSIHQSSSICRRYEMMMVCGCEENVTLNKVIVSHDCDFKIYSFATYFYLTFFAAAMNNDDHVGVGWCA